MKKIVLLLVFAAPCSVIADDFNHCNSLIQHGITNITRYKSADHTIAYKWHSNCGLNFNSASDSDVKRANASIFGYGSGGAEGNTTHQRDQLEQWCNENKSFAEKNKNLYEEARTISDPALQAWNHCQEISKKGVFISTSPYGGHSDFVHFEIDSTLDADLRLFANTTSNYECTTLLSAKEGSNKGILMGYNPSEQPLIRNANIHINCTRVSPSISTNNGMVKSKYEQAYISIQTSGPSMQFYAPEVIDEYIATPKGAIVAFKENCPNGWSEYKEAYGRFIRGIDKSGQNIDPKKDRKIGELQDDAIKLHNHAIIDPGHTHTVGAFGNSGNIYDSGGGRSAWAYYGAPTLSVSSSQTNISIKDFGSEETRPKNVSLLYCEKN